MGRWVKGERVVEFLLERGRLEPIEVRGLQAQAEALLQRATLREATAGKALEVSDIDGAYVAAYDAYRIGAERRRFWLAKAYARQRAKGPT